MPNKTCPYCGKETNQTDLRQKDADGNWWHCVCADETLALFAQNKSQYDPTDNDEGGEPD